MNIYQNKVLWVTMIVRLEMPLKQMLKNQSINKNSLDYAKVNQVKASIPKPTPINVGGDSNVKSQIANFAMIYVLTFVIYMTVVQFGGIVATNGC